MKIKIKIVAAFVLAIFVVPGMVSAQSVDELQA